MGYFVTGYVASVTSSFCLSEAAGVCRYVFHFLGQKETINHLAFVFFAITEREREMVCVCVCVCAKEKEEEDWAGPAGASSRWLTTVNQ